MRYRMYDGTVIDTYNAMAAWPEERDWDGHNMVGRSSRPQWHSQTLCRSRRGLITACTKAASRASTTSASG